MPELSRVLTIHLLPPVCSSLLMELVCSGSAQNVFLWMWICLLTDFHSKGTSMCFWLLRIILQQERGGRVEHWAASQLWLSHQQILHQWPRGSLENYCSINPRSYSYHLENETHNFLSFPKKSSSHKIQTAILKKRLKKDPSSQIQKPDLGLEKLFPSLRALYCKPGLSPGCTNYFLNLTLS